ncbi:MAG: hypothetical protein ACRC2K_07440 [Clostridium sp.]
MVNKNSSKVATTLKIFGIIMVGLAMFSVYASNKYIGSLIAQGYDPSKQVADVLNYYINNVTPYVFYAICLFTLSYIVKRVEEIWINNNPQSIYEEYKQKVIKSYDNENEDTEENDSDNEGDVVEDLLKELDK